MHGKEVEKNPTLYGIITGQGLLVGFILLEYFLVATGISHCGIIVDSCIRIAVGVIALFLLKRIYRDGFCRLFTSPPNRITWLCCIPFLLYLATYVAYFPMAESLTLEFAGDFALACLQQLATGFFEEATSKGLLMSGMLKRWRMTVKGRLGMVFLSGLLFGSGHILNFLFGNDIISCLWQSLYASAFGVLLAAIYLQSGNLLFCMILHAVWDIVIRIPNYFCNNVNGDFLNVANVTHDILELVFFPIVAILICVTYKEVQREENLICEGNKNG